MTKTCSFCHFEKEIESFARRGKSKNGTQKYQTVCKECNKEYLKKHYNKNKQYYKNKAIKSTAIYRKKAYDYLKEYAKNGCIICGEKDFACIQFDHRNPEEKEYNISHMMGSGYSLESIKKELLKCDALCANCHAKRTAKQFNWYNCLD